VQRAVANHAHDPRTGSRRRAPARSAARRSRWSRRRRPRRSWRRRPGFRCSTSRRRSLPIGVGLAEPDGRRTTRRARRPLRPRGGRPVRRAGNHAPPEHPGIDALPEREQRTWSCASASRAADAEAIGHELDLTRERVRQLEGQALSRLAALRELAGLAA
jgi:hypothetical protein